MWKLTRATRDVAVKRRRRAGRILVACAAAVGATLSAGAEARSQAAPANVSPPAVSGTAVTGETLTASPGSWTGTAPLTFTYAWQRCDAGGATCAPIGGATAARRCASRSR